MGAADEVSQDEGVQISYTYARQTRVTLHERVRLRFLRVRETSMTTSTRQEQRKSRDL